jgi:hypothetical protein
MSCISASLADAAGPAAASPHPPLPPAIDFSQRTSELELEVVALKASLASQSLISTLTLSMCGKSAITEQHSGASSLPEMQHLLDFKAAFDAASADVQDEAEKASRCEPTHACHTQQPAFLKRRNRSARAAVEKAESDRESFRIVALDCITQYVAARREFVAACSQVQEQLQQQTHDVVPPTSTMQRFFAKCEEIVSTTHSHCDSQLKSWQQQRAQLLQAHAHSIQQLQVLLASSTSRASQRSSHRVQAQYSQDTSFRQRLSSFCSQSHYACCVTLCSSGSTVNALYFR